MMVFRGIHFLTMLTLLVIIVNIIDIKMLVAAQCQGNLEGLMQECTKYVQKFGPKLAPSQSCCKVLQTADLPCVCHHITPEEENIISMEKSVYVASCCGKPLPHGTVCGSYTVP